MHLISGLLCPLGLCHLTWQVPHVLPYLVSRLPPSRSGPSDCIFPHARIPKAPEVDVPDKDFYTPPRAEKHGAYVVDGS